MRKIHLCLMIAFTLCSFGMLSCSSGPKEKKIEFVYMALGASDATGVGALPLTEGYVYLSDQSGIGSSDSWGGLNQSRGSWGSD